MPVFTTGKKEIENEIKVEEIEPVSSLSLRLSRLKTAAIKATKKRERFPATLFWSLFTSEINNVKKKRAKLRKERAKIFNCDWL